jgi:predicted nucleic acid-binding protein
MLRGLVAAGATLGCSAITIGEMYAGMRPHERAATEALLAELTCYDVTSEVARGAGLLRNEWKSKGQTLALDDMIIAATVIAHGLVLLTDNRKDFPMPELGLYPPM